MNVAAVSCSNRSAAAPDGNSPESEYGIARGDAGRDHHMIAHRHIIIAQHLRLLGDADEAVGADQGTTRGRAATDLHGVPPLYLTIGVELPVSRPIAHDAAANGIGMATRGADSVEFGIHIGTRGCMADRDQHDGGRRRRRGQRLRHHRRHRSPDHAGDAGRHLPVHGHRPAPRRGARPSASTPSPRWRFSPAARRGSGCWRRSSVVPYRPAMLTAKLFQTADVLSGGRIDRRCRRRLDEGRVRHAGTPPFAERGAVTDEYIDGVEDPVDPGAALDARQICPVRERDVRAEAGVETASADLGRRRKPARRSAARRGSATPGIPPAHARLPAEHTRPC